ncbi:MAG TPA: hypothetical protein VFH02_05055 [Jiangellaceae bacterium]|nr:hypothetical protein [Jiangellaceae bacterium]
MRDPARSRGDDPAEVAALLAPGDRPGRRAGLARDRPTVTVAAERLGVAVVG